MSNLLKDVYSPEFYARLGDCLETVIDDFDRRAFEQAIFSPAFAGMELKQRMTHTIEVIAGLLPLDYADAIEHLKALIVALQAAGHQEQSFEYMFLPEYIETHGFDHFDLSIGAFEFVTQFTSCEFAVRPFIHHYGQPMLDRMLDWSRHSHEMVRRLASEGSRPRLPWAMALPALKKDPSPLLPILDSLKQDPSESVRRSVANNLNDISKDNSAFVIERVREWQGLGSDTGALLKHACRSLLKQGDPQTLALFGYDSTGIEVNEFTVDTPSVAFGDSLAFHFKVENASADTKLVRLEYAIYHLKKNGNLTPKVFKISERELAAGARDRIERKHRIKPITTRQYYAGEHRVSVIVNGRETESIEFQLEI
jgi:3-methyladenine DNA glycosylase AlkC